MNEDQANQIIALLEEIRNSLSDIKNDTSDIFNVASNTAEAVRYLERIAGN